MKWRFKAITLHMRPTVYRLALKPCHSRKLPLAGGFWVLENPWARELWVLRWQAMCVEELEVKSGRRALPGDVPIPDWTGNARLLTLSEDKTLKWIWNSPWARKRTRPEPVDPEVVRPRRRTFVPGTYGFNVQARREWVIGTFLDLPDVSKLMPVPHVLADYLEEKCGDQRSRPPGVNEREVNATRDWYGFVLALRDTVG